MTQCAERQIQLLDSYPIPLWREVLHFQVDFFKNSGAAVIHGHYWGSNTGSGLMLWAL